FHAAIDHRDALIHVLERRLEEGLLLGKLALAFLQFGDVACGADHAHGAALLVARCETMGARPSPRTILGAVAVIALEARGVALQVRDRHFTKMGEIVGVNAGVPVLEALEGAGRQPERPVHALEEFDVTRGDVPVVSTFVDRPHHDLVAPLDFAQPPLGLPKTLAQRGHLGIACPVTLTRFACLHMPSVTASAAAIWKPCYWSGSRVARCKVRAGRAYWR